MNVYTEHLLSIRVVMVLCPSGAMTSCQKIGIRPVEIVFGDGVHGWKKEKNHRILHKTSTRITLTI